MGNLHEVVEFHALSYRGRAHRGAVHARVGTYLNVVFNGHNAYLRNLVVLIGFRIWREAEAVGANDRAGMQHDIVADMAAVVNAHVWVEKAVGANLDTFHDGDVGVDLAAISNLHAIGYISESTDIAVVTNLGFW